jgi:hypothetical protein
MEGGRDGKQDLAKEIEGRPQQHNTHKELGYSYQSGQAAPLDGRNAELFKTRGADHPPFMLAYAFPAKISSAFRAACHGLAESMIKTPLLGYVHGSLP